MRYGLAGCAAADERPSTRPAAIPSARKARRLGCRGRAQHAHDGAKPRVGPFIGVSPTTFFSGRAYGPEQASARVITMLRDSSAGAEERADAIRAHLGVLDRPGPARVEGGLIVDEAAIAPAVAEPAV